LYRSKASFNLLELRPQKSRREEPKVFRSSSSHGRVLSRGNAVCEKLLLKIVNDDRNLSFFHFQFLVTGELYSGILFPIQTDKSLHPHFYFSYLLCFTNKFLLLFWYLPEGMLGVESSSFFPKRKLLFSSTGESL
jgi:hypothetical protein